MAVESELHLRGYSSAPQGFQWQEHYYWISQWLQLRMGSYIQELIEPCLVSFSHSLPSCASQGYPPRLPPTSKNTSLAAPNSYTNEFLTTGQHLYSRSVRLKPLFD